MLQPYRYAHPTLKQHSTMHAYHRINHIGPPDGPLDLTHTAKPNMQPCMTHHFPMLI